MKLIYIAFISGLSFFAYEAGKTKNLSSHRLSIIDMILSNDIIEITNPVMYDGGGGGAGVLRPLRPSPTTKNFLTLPIPYFKVFLEKFFNATTPHHPTSSIFHCYPHPSPLPPLKRLIVQIRTGLFCLVVALECFQPAL